MILTTQGLNGANTYFDPKGSQAIVAGPAGHEIRQQSSISFLSTLHILWTPDFSSAGAAGH
jgi:hypothetical protein